MALPLLAAAPDAASRSRARVAAALIVFIALLFIGAWPRPESAHAAMPGRGDVRVTVFDDRVVDGKFSGGMTNAAGSKDTKRTDRFAYLRDAGGNWRSGSADAKGDYVFPNVVPGPASVYVVLRGPHVREVALQTGSTTVLPQRTDISFSDGDYVGPSGQTSKTSLAAGERMAETSVIVNEGSEAAISIAITALQASATVGIEGDSLTPVSDHATISFLSNGHEIAAKDDGSATYRTAPDVFFPASDIGVRVAPKQGYRVLEVTASTPNGRLGVRQNKTDWTVSTLELPFSEGFIKFNVVVAPIGSASPTPGGETETAEPEATTTETAAPVPPPPSSEAEPAPVWPWIVGGSLIGGGALIASVAVAIHQRRKGKREEAEEESSLPDISAFAPREYGAVPSHSPTPGPVVPGGQSSGFAHNQPIVPGGAPLPGAHPAAGLAGHRIANAPYPPAAAHPHPAPHQHAMPPVEAQPERPESQTPTTQNPIVSQSRDQEPDRGPSSNVPRFGRRGTGSSFDD